MSNEDAFVRWFQQATGNEPYPFQIRFAHGDWLRNAVPVPSHQGGVEGGRGQGEEGLRGQGLLVDVPTCLRACQRGARKQATYRQAGMGKTAMAMLGGGCPGDNGSTAPEEGLTVKRRMTDSAKRRLTTSQLMREILEIVRQARAGAYRALNAAMVEAYWQIGRRIVEEEQQGRARAGYGPGTGRRSFTPWHTG